MTSPTTELIAELDELIATETVRTRHVRLVRARGLAERIVDMAAPDAGLDNVITPESDHSA